MTAHGVLAATLVEPGKDTPAIHLPEPALGRERIRKVVDLLAWPPRLPRRRGTDRNGL